MNRPRLYIWPSMAIPGPVPGRIIAIGQDLATARQNALSAFAATWPDAGLQQLFALGHDLDAEPEVQDLATFVPGRV